MPLNVGQIIEGRYRIVKQLGEGGFGMVYKAWDMRLENHCAIKENIDTSTEAERQFTREAKLLAGLKHPNLPRVSDYFFVPNQGQYLVMDMVEGQDLQEILEAGGGPLTEPEALNWILQVCDALEYLHSQNPPIIHRDIKPANIKITPLLDSGKSKAILVDFGLAKNFDPGIKTTLGAQAVTPGYSPQEQYGRGVTDTRSDIYALGATLYTLLTGQEPPESIGRNLGEALTPPRALNPNISPHVERAVLKSMEMLPNQRFQSARAFQLALEGEPDLSKPSSPSLSSGKTLSPIIDLARPRWIVWLSIISVALIIILILINMTGQGEEEIISTLEAPVVLITTKAVLPTRVMPTVTSTLEILMLPWVYTVQADDTCSSIARRLGVTIEDIQTINNLEPECEGLFAGQILLIPMTTSSTEATPIPSASSQHNLGESRTAKKDGMDQVFVPAGVFWMGSGENDFTAEADEKPRRAVYLDAFWIDRFEVTNAMFARCVDAGGCRLPAQLSSPSRLFYFDQTAYDKYPVIYVSWDDARDYCQWAGRRLPTEAEWEKAARGTDGRTYPWGDMSPDRSLANYNKQVGDTTPVGNYPDGVSPYGAMDMAGNVGEWVADWYADSYYAYGSISNPFGPEVGEFRVLRGGSWFNLAHVIRSAYRLWNIPNLGFETSGFRCAVATFDD